MKHLEHNQEFRLNEILFENRNKAYGAYVLRTESDRILTKAFFIGVGLLAAVSIIPTVISAFQSTETIPTETPQGPIVLVIPDEPPVKKPEKVLPPEKITPPPPSVKQYNATIAIPTRNADESNIVKKIPDDAIAGVKNDFTAPPAPNINVPTSVISGPGTVAPPRITPPVEVPEKVSNEPEIAAVSAKFEGGIDAFRNKVMSKFDVSAFEDEGSVSTTVTFIVEKDGTISDIKTNGKDASFNAEAIRTIKAVKGKWVPGKNKKGESVRSYFKFPISMKFDN